MNFKHEIDQARDLRRARNASPTPQFRRQNRTIDRR